MAQLDIKLTVNEDPQWYELQRKIVNERRSQIKQWLEPLGFQPIYSLNHPTISNDEVHYIKDRVRLCIRFLKDREHAYTLKEYYYKGQLFHLKGNKEPVYGDNVIRSHRITVEQAQSISVGIRPLYVIALIVLMIAISTIGVITDVLNVWSHANPIWAVISIVLSITLIGVIKYERNGSK